MTDPNEDIIAAMLDFRLRLARTLFLNRSGIWPTPVTDSYNRKHPNK